MDLVQRCTADAGDGHHKKHMPVVKLHLNGLQLTISLTCNMHSVMTYTHLNLGNFTFYHYMTEVSLWPCNNVHTLTDLLSRYGLKSARILRSWGIGILCISVQEQPYMLPYSKTTAT